MAEGVGARGPVRRTRRADGHALRRHAKPPLDQALGVVGRDDHPVRPARRDRLRAPGSRAGFLQRSARGVRGSTGRGWSRTAPPSGMAAGAGASTARHQSCPRTSPRGAIRPCATPGSGATRARVRRHGRCRGRRPPGDGPSRSWRRASGSPSRSAVPEAPPRADARILRRRSVGAGRAGSPSGYARAANRSTPKVSQILVVQ